MIKQGHWTNKDDKWLSENFENKTNTDLAKKLRRTENSIRNRLNTLFLTRKKNVYAYYKNDDLLGIGTVYELSEQLNLSVHTIRAYATPSRQNNNVKVIKVED